MLSKIQLCKDSLEKIAKAEDITLEEGRALLNYFSTSLNFANMENYKMNEDMTSDELKQNILLVMNDCIVSYYKITEGISE